VSVCEKQGAEINNDTIVMSEHKLFFFIFE
jgi:hypothetical protein